MKWQTKVEATLIEQLILKLGETYSKKHLKRLIDHNLCKVNNTVCRISTRKILAKAWVELSLDLPTPPPPPLILFEDPFLFVINKPAGVMSEAKTLEKLLQRPLFLVHRLDKDTTGLLVLAKDKTTQKELEDLFRNRLVTKKYLALVDGIPKEPSGVVEAPIALKQEIQGQKIYHTVRSGGKSAKTSWIRKKVGNQCALLECTPETGRTHQIRVHLASIGHPLLGDHLYSRKFLCSKVPPHFILHAELLAFPHPKTGKEISFYSPKLIETF